MVHYRIYIDESGNHDLNVGANSPHRYLSLTGIMINEDYARVTAKAAVEDLKTDHFGHWPEPVILHRKDIIDKVGPFEVLKNPEREKAFNEALLKIFESLNYAVITVIIDKYAHKEKYRVWQASPYHYCMEVITEKYAQWLVRQNGKGDVVAEARTTQLDKKLKKAFRYFYRNGTRYVKKPEMQALLTSSELKLFCKKDNVAVLQLADLIAHPSQACIKAWRFRNPLPNNFGGRIAEILLDDKYDRSWWGKITGYGRKWLP